MSKQGIYLDYSATTPMAKEVFEAIRPYLEEVFGNASSIHQYGQEARAAVDEARANVAKFLNCTSAEIVFTSGATESNNLALKGVLRQLKLSNNAIKNPHIIVSKIEHHSVLDSARALEKDGIEVTYLPVNHDGLVEIKTLEDAIKENTVLISIMYANNEIGTIQPIEEIVKIVSKIKKEKGSAYPLFHADAVQAAGYLDCDVARLGVDLLTISGHKIYAPKGIGASYIKKGTPIAKIQDGGSHELGRRAGTMNVAGIVGLGKAVTLIKEINKEKTKKLRDYLIKEIFQKIKGAILNGSADKRLPNNVNFSFPGAEGEALVISLDQEGIAASTGSSCAAEGLEPSHILKAIGLSDLDAHSSLRLTLGRYTTKTEIDKVLEVLPPIIDRLRQMSGDIAQRFENKKAIPDDFGC